MDDGGIPSHERLERESQTLTIKLVLNVLFSLRVQRKSMYNSACMRNS